MNMKDIWVGDKLGRAEEALYLQRYLENVYSRDSTESSFVLNVNSEWGHGKTFFLSRFAEQLSINHPVITFDAWKNDFTKDALLSFVSVVCADLAKRFSYDTNLSGKVSRVNRSFKDFLSKSGPLLVAIAAKQLTGVGIDYWLADGIDESSEKNAVDAVSSIAKLAARCAIEEFQQKRTGIDQFVSAVQALVEQISKSPKENLPIYIFVDELDRCRPTYAIELLESIKHLFSVRGVCFIIASDTKQLSHSIKAIYGQDFEARSYLKRFFYAEYKLAKPDYDKFSNHLFREFKISDRLFLPRTLVQEYGFTGIFSKISEFFSLSVRDQEQVFMIVETVVLTAEQEIIDFIFILFLVCLKLKPGDDSDYFLRNANTTQLMEYLRGAMKSGNCKDVSISTVVAGTHGRDRNACQLTDVFAYYLGLQRSNLQKLRTQKPKFMFQEEINDELARRIEASPTKQLSNDLWTYFDMLAMAGRITRIAKSQK